MAPRCIQNAPNLAPVAPSYRPADASELRERAACPICSREFLQAWELFPFCRHYRVKQHGGRVAGDAPDGMNSDEAVMLDFQRGSRAAFEELYARYQGPLYGFSPPRLDSSARAAELAQETFLLLLRRDSPYAPPTKIPTSLP